VTRQESIRTAIDALSEYSERREERPPAPERLLVSAAVDVLRAALEIDRAALERNDALAEARNRIQVIELKFKEFAAGLVHFDELAKAIQEATRE
jgi:hypothetical protein